VPPVVAEAVRNAGVAADKYWFQKKKEKKSLCAGSIGIE
jgi:hypothetical protein